METYKSVLQDLLHKSTQAGIRILIGILIIVIGFKIVKYLLRLMKKGRAFQRLDSSLASFLLSFVNIALRVVILITAAGEMGLPITSFITMLASAGVAIGLALQGALSNLAGGIMLLMFHPFGVGDYIETTDGAGTVRSITVFYTVIVTADNRHITLPNGNLTASAITNYSAAHTRRVELLISVAYDSDMEQVKKIIGDVLTAHEKVLSDPAPLCRLKEQGESALVFTARAWCNTADYWDVYFDLNEQIKSALDKAGISIPYPQMDVHLHQ